MSKYHEPRVNRGTAALMLRGAPVIVPDALADLLAAAVAPPRDGELVGERPATAAFLEAARQPTGPALRQRTKAHRRRRWSACAMPTSRVPAPAMARRCGTPRSRR
ncbi:MAG TPA: hypothetical protein VFW65_37275 [Pseudonocardiaceae bacterium]|nr:hypothetical protein [Pseudonocardiaceae bacterium]